MVCKRNAVLDMVPNMGLEVSSFAGPDGAECFEYTVAGSTLAYLDVYKDEAVVTVFKPYEGHSKRYGKRSRVKAEGILSRHLEREGYKLEDAQPR